MNLVVIIKPRPPILPLPRWCHLSIITTAPPTINAANPALHESPPPCVCCEQRHFLFAPTTRVCLFSSVRTHRLPAAFIRHICPTLPLALALALPSTNTPPTNPSIRVWSSLAQSCERSMETEGEKKRNAPRTGETRGEFRV